MGGKRAVHHLNSLPFILTDNDKVIEVGDKFVELTGYDKALVLGMDINYLCCNLLRLTHNFKELDQGQKSFFIFTKGLEPREVKIEVRALVEESRELVTFCEKPDSRLETKDKYLYQLCRGNLMGVAVYTADLVLVMANQKYLDFLEYPYNQREYSIGRRIEDIIGGWKGSPAEGFWREAVNTRKPVQVNEYMHKGYKKGVTYWDLIITPVLERGKVKFVVSNMTDATERMENRRKVEEQLGTIKRKNAELQAIIDSIPDDLYYIEKDGAIIPINSSAKNNLKGDGNYTLLNKAAHDILPNNFFDKVGEGCQPLQCYGMEGNEIPFSEMPHFGILRGEKTDEQIFEVVVPEGKKYLGVSGTPLFGDDGKLSLGILCVRDITEFNRQNQTIKQQKEELETIIDNMSEGLAVIDKYGNYTRMNKKVKEYAGKAAGINVEEAKNVEPFKMGGRYYDMEGRLLAPEELPYAKVIRGEVFKNQRLVIKCDDRCFYYDYSGIPIFDKKGEFKLGIINSCDVTEQVMCEQIIKEQQEQLLKAERAEKQVLEKAMKMKDEFLAAITHEFKTPLTVINAAVQTIETIYGSEVSENVRKHIRRIKINSFRQLRLVNNILDITRYKAGHFKIQKENMDIVYLSRYITKSVDIYAKQKGVKLKFSSDIAFKEIAIDEEKYERILLNLLSNAIKFTPRGGTIYVEVYCKKKKVIVSVRDEGIGIPKNKIGMIFERFGQVNSSLSQQAEGTGIGLTLVKALVDGLGGTIDVISEVGRGSTFTVEFPAVKLKRRSVEKKAAPREDSRIMQALVIEFSDIYLD